MTTRPRLVHAQQEPTKRQPWLSDRARDIITYVIAAIYSAAFTIGFIWLAWWGWQRVFD